MVDNYNEKYNHDRFFKSISYDDDAKQSEGGEEIQM